MDDSTSDESDDDLLAPGGSSGPVYAAMLGATIVGQLVGIGIDALAGRHNLVLPAACSVLFEAWAGARLGARVAGRPLDAAGSGRLSGGYSLALLGVSVLFASWFSVSRHAGPADRPVWTAGVVASWLGALAFATVVRWGLMIAFAPRRR